MRVASSSAGINYLSYYNIQATSIVPSGRWFAVGSQLETQ